MSLDHLLRMDLRGTRESLDGPWGHVAESKAMAAILNSNLFNSKCTLYSRQINVHMKWSPRELLREGETLHITCHRTAHHRGGGLMGELTTLTISLR